MWKARLPSWVQEVDFGSRCKSKAKPLHYFSRWRSATIRYWLRWPRTRKPAKSAEDGSGAKQARSPFAPLQLARVAFAQRIQPLRRRRPSNRRCSSARKCGRRSQISRGRRPLSNRHRRPLSSRRPLPNRHRHRRPLPNRHRVALRLQRGATLRRSPTSSATMSRQLESSRTRHPVAPRSIFAAELSSAATLSQLSTELRRAPPVSRGRLRSSRRRPRAPSPGAGAVRRKGRPPSAFSGPQSS